MKAHRCSAFPSRCSCEWRAPRVKGTVTVKIANAAIIVIINHSIRYFPLHWGISLVTAGFFKFFWLQNKAPNWSCLINMLDGLLSLSLPFQGLLGWRAGYCAVRQAFFNFYGVVVLFLQVIFSPSFFLFASLRTVISLHTVLLKLLPAFWLQATFSKGFDICMCVFLCAHCERDVWVSGLSGGVCQLFSEEMKMGSRAKKWPETSLRPLRRACEILWGFGCSECRCRNSWNIRRSRLVLFQNVQW